MAATNITGLTNYGGGQQPADLMYVGRSPFNPTDDRKTTLNDLFSTVTRNITERSLQWTDSDGVATVSAASSGKIRYSAGSQQFQFSQNGGAYFGLNSIPFAVIITSTAAPAFAVGPGGATNPCFQVVANVASAETGLSITGRAAGAGVSLAVISSGANEDLSIEPKGSGNTRLASGLLQFGGSTASEPALRRSGGLLEVRTADDSAYSTLRAGIFTAFTEVRLNESITQLLGGSAGTFDVGLLRAGAGYWRVTDGSTGTGSFLIGASSITLTGGPKLLIGSTAAAILEAGPNGETNPIFRIVANVASAATGLSITGRAAGAGVSLAVISSGANENLSLEPKGTGGAIVTSSGATAFAVGPNGATNPGLLVVGNIASAATGLSITGRAAGAGVDLTVISSGSNETLNIFAKGTGSVIIDADLFAMGTNGNTNPAFRVVSSTGSSVTGLSITGAGAGNAVSLAVISSGTNEDLSVEPKGTGNLYVGNGITNAAPASKIINGTGGSGTNITGATITVAPGKGTGNAAQALACISYPLFGASGTTLQSLSSGSYPILANNFTQITDVTVTQNTDTSIFTTGVDSTNTNIEAGQARVGRTWYFRVTGDFAVVATNTLTIKVKLSGTTVATIVITGVANDTGPFLLEVTCAVIVSGTSGTFNCEQVRFNYVNLAAAKTVAGSGQITTVDFSTSKTIDVTGAYSAVAGGNAWQVFHIFSQLIR